MFWMDFLIVLAIALLIAALFASAGTRTATALDLLAFFLLLFLATWALGGWFRPIGPPMWGTYWLSYLIAAVVIAALLVAALSLPGNKTRPAAEETRQEAHRATAVLLGLGTFFWFFALIAVVAIIAGYFL